MIHKITLLADQVCGQLPPTYALLRAMFEVDDPRLEVEAFGVKFRNPIGMAAGYDKDGVAVRGLSALGFGHIEVGTVTRQKQIGNPKPRVHRVIESQGVINSMGFPNSGVEALKIGAARRKSASTSARAKTHRSNGRLRITWNCSGRCIERPTMWRSTSVVRIR